MFFLALLSYEKDIAIDRAISAPGHGKGIADGISGATKQYLKQMMLAVLKPTEDSTDAGADRKAPSHTVTDGDRKSVV